MKNKIGTYPFHSFIFGMLLLIANAQVGRQMVEIVQKARGEPQGVQNRIEKASIAQIA